MLNTCIKHHICGICNKITNAPCIHYTAEYEVIILRTYINTKIVSETKIAAVIHMIKKNDHKKELGSLTKIKTQMNALKKKNKQLESRNITNK